MNIFDHILSATESSDLETNKCAANNSEQLQVVFNEIDAYLDSQFDLDITKCISIWY